MRYPTYLLVLLTAFAGCRSKGAPADDSLPFAAGQVVYTRVGMHFDARRGKYLAASTNYVGVPHYLPPNTQLTFNGATRRGVTLSDGDGTEYQISYNRRHSIPLEAWLTRQFSTEPVTLPETLTEDEREAIAAGECRAGMSRNAVFLAWGYPPHSTNPSLNAKTLNYEWLRVVKRSVRFGADDRVEQVGGRRR
ncbi:MAG TPA: hypothetical protein ENI87_07115 [bacterium]|nr:hypothetical protein [bacterium]